MRDEKLNGISAVAESKQPKALSLNEAKGESELEPRAAAKECELWGGCKNARHTRQARHTEIRT